MAGLRFHFSLWLIMLAGLGCAGSRMQAVQLSSDSRGFVLSPSGKVFHPWGDNYAANGFAPSSEHDWEKVDRDFADLVAMRANVIRVHLQFPQFMDGPNQPNAEALDRLRRLIRSAEEHHLYLDITGLACYRKDRRSAWYDLLSDEARWAAQAHFWEAVARTCADSPAIFCYDLINEPILFGTRKEGWYTGEFGGYEFLQRLSLDHADRPGDALAANWTRQMVAAIRRRDPKHLITIGMLPAWGIPLKSVAGDLDFVAVHIYPAAGKVDDAIANLKRFDIGKPIVIEETFPLSCSVADERTFLLKSRGIATGWLGHYPEQSLEELQALQRAGKITLPQAIYLQWFDLFQEIGPEMLGESTRKLDPRDNQYGRKDRITNQADDRHDPGESPE